MPQPVESGQMFRVLVVGDFSGRASRRRTSSPSAEFRARHSRSRQFRCASLRAHVRRALELPSGAIAGRPVQIALEQPRRLRTRLAVRPPAAVRPIARSATPAGRPGDVRAGGGRDACRATRHRRGCRRSRRQSRPAAKTMRPRLQRLLGSAPALPLRQPQPRGRQRRFRSRPADAQRGGAVHRAGNRRICSSR